MILLGMWIGFFLLFQEEPLLSMKLSVGRDRREIICEGTSQLPEGTIFRCSLFYGPARLGEQWMMRQVEVREGGFWAIFSSDKSPLLSGLYAVEVCFAEDQRVSLPFEVLREKPNFAAFAEVRVGTPEEACRELLEVHRRIAERIVAVSRALTSLTQVSGEEREAEVRRVREAFLEMREAVAKDSVWRMLRIEKRLVLFCEDAAGVVESVVLGEEEGISRFERMRLELLRELGGGEVEGFSRKTVLEDLRSLPRREREQAMRLVLLFAQLERDSVKVARLASAARRYFSQEGPSGSEEFEGVLRELESD